MSGAVATAAAVAAGAMVVGTGYSIYAGEQQRKAQSEAASKQADYNNKQLEAQQNALSNQKSAQAAAAASALKQEKTSEEATNRSLAKTPNANAILSAAEQSSKSGVGGTMLTGAQGVDPASLTLDKKTLLGG